jgi:hypothetical protein
MTQAKSKPKDKTCSLCGKKIPGRGGHYYGKLPLYSKAELEKMRRSGTKKVKLWADADMVSVYRYDPKPYAQIPYWECSACDRNLFK